MNPNSDGAIYLDEYRLADAAVLAEVGHDPEHRKRFEFPNDFVSTLEHAENVIRRWTEERKLGTSYGFAVRDIQTHQLVGGCEIRIRESGSANLSYWTHPEYRRRGIASRAVAIACWRAVNLSVQRLEILVDPDNHASMRVAINNSFVLSGTRGNRVCYELDLRKTAPCNE